jgi:hypothetical protein
MRARELGAERPEQMEPDQTRSHPVFLHRKILS